MLLTLPDGPDERDVYRCLGYPDTAVPDEATRARVHAVCEALLTCARPRMVWKEIALSHAAPLLQGEDIAAHLAGCRACALLAVTLGAPVDAFVRSMGARDVTDAVLADTAASVLAEGAAQRAEEQVRAFYQARGEYLTARFSPGYGDFPVTVQAQVLALLDAPRAIGLCATQSSMLTPRKSVTALCGMAAQPVTGKLAGCAHCALRGTCAFRRKGKQCHDEKSV